MSLFDPKLEFVKKRRFQASGFGSDRCEETDGLPSWKQQIYDRIINKSHKHHQRLIDRLHANRKNNKFSPNSKSKKANEAIDSFKKEIITSEIEEIRKQFKPDEIDQEMENLNKEDFESMMEYLEDNYFKTIRDDEIYLLMQTYENQENDKEKYIENLMDIEEILNNNNNNNKSIPPSFSLEYYVLCPICKESSIEIEEINCPSNGQKILRIYSCLCGTQFQCANDYIRYPQLNESGQDHIKKLLSSLKNRLNQILFYHENNKQCKNKLLFRVAPEQKYLQCWCNYCNYNDLVI